MMISRFGMAGKCLILCAVLYALVSACSADNKQASPKGSSSPIVVLSPRPQTLTPEQRNELAFPPELIAQVEKAAGSPAEAFYEPLQSPSENLKGDVMLSRNRLAGFSVRSAKAEKVMSGLSASLLEQGYLVFRSEQNYGRVPDVITVIRGRDQYDILAVQKTEGPSYNVSTKAIVKWLKARQKKYPFIITGAGSDWVETRFIRPPKDFRAFAREIYAFAPDVVSQGARTVNKLAEEIKQSNGFYLWWD